METSILHVLLPALGIVVSFFKSFKFIQEGEQGIKLRFGKAVRDRQGNPRVIDPGFVLLIPWIESLKRHHVRQQTIRFVNQVILTKDHLTFSVNAVVIFKVKDIYKALFEIFDLNQSIEDIGMGLLRDEVSSRKHDELSDTEEISQKLLETIKVRAQEWGVEFVQFKLTDCAPTPETAPLVVVGTGAKLRAAALIEAAKDLGVAVQDLPPEIGAVLVGVPLVGAISSRLRQVAPPRPGAEHTGLEEEKPSLIERMLTS